MKLCRAPWDDQGVGWVLPKPVRGRRHTDVCIEPGTKSSCVSPTKPQAPQSILRALALALNNLEFHCLWRSVLKTTQQFIFYHKLYDFILFQGYQNRWHFGEFGRSEFPLWVPSVVLIQFLGTFFSRLVLEVVLGPSSPRSTGLDSTSGCRASYSEAEWKEAAATH